MLEVPVPLPRRDGELDLTDGEAAVLVAMSGATSTGDVPELGHAEPRPEHPAFHPTGGKDPLGPERPGGPPQEKSDEHSGVSVVWRWQDPANQAVRLLRCCLPSPRPRTMHEQLIVHAPLSGIRRGQQIATRRRHHRGSARQPHQRRNLRRLAEVASVARSGGRGPSPPRDARCGTSLGRLWTSCLQFCCNPKGLDQWGVCVRFEDDPLPWTSLAVSPGIWRPREAADIYEDVDPAQNVLRLKNIRGLVSRTGVGHARL